MSDPVSKSKSLSMKDVILQVLLSCHNKGVRPNPYQLSVLCWMENKKMFGLRGFEQEHPNYHTFRCNFYGRRALFGRDFVDSDGVNIVLTTKGFARARELPLI